MTGHRSRHRRRRRPGTSATRCASSARSPPAPASSTARNRDVVQVSGDDRLTWLHSICSQHVSDLARRRRDRGARAVSARPRRAALAGRRTRRRRLDRHRARRRTRPCSTTCRRCASSSGSSRSTSRPTGRCSASSGPATPDVLTAAGTAGAGRRAAPSPLDGGGFVRRMAWPAPDAVDLLVPVRRPRALPRPAARPPAPRRPASGPSRPLRVEARRPRLGFETDHRTIPHEIGFIGTRRAPRQGLLPRAGDGRAGAQPRQAAAPAGAAAPVRRVRRAAAARHAGRGRPDAPSGSSAPRCTTTSSGPIALAVIKRALPDDAALTVGGHAAAIDH